MSGILTKSPDQFNILSPVNCVIFTGSDVAIFIRDATNPSSQQSRPSVNPQVKTGSLHLPSFPMEDSIFSRSSHGKALRVGMSSGNTARLRPSATAALLQTCFIRGPRTDVSDESLSCP